MAKIVKQTILIELSQLVKDGASADMDAVTQDLLINLEAVTQELVGAGIVVEVSELTQ
jgi:hypothetical protein